MKLAKKQKKLNHLEQKFLRLFNEKINKGRNTVTLKLFGFA
jgi:hypothetical protein